MLNTQVGLGAMMAPNPNTDTAGMSARGIGALYGQAKDLSDAELASVLTGKSMAVPQWVAMTEAMGRRQLRTAAQGQTAQRPSVKDQALEGLEQDEYDSPAMGMGLGRAPAPNLEGMNEGEGMATGGVVAFGKGGSTNDESEAAAMYGALGVDPSQFAGINRVFSPIVGAPEGYATPSVEEAVNKGLGATRGSLANALAPTAPHSSAIMPPSAIGGLWSAATPSGAPEYVGEAEATGSAGAPAIAEQKNPISGAPPKKSVGAVTPAQPNQKDPLPNFPQRNDYFAGLDNDDTPAQVSKLKEQAQGEFLLNLGVGLLSNPNLATGLAAGVKAGLPGLAENRKTVASLLKDQKAYQLNLAQAKEARDRGDDTLALHKAELAEKIAHNAGTLAATNRQIDATAAYHNTSLANQAAHYKLLADNKALALTSKLHTDVTRQLDKQVKDITEKDFTGRYASPEAQEALRAQLYPSALARMQGQQPPAQAPTNPFGIDPAAIAGELARRAR